MVAAFSFIDLGAFKALTIMPPGNVDAVEASNPGWIDRQLAFESANIVSRLSKRYGPFVPPYPTAILRWLVQIVTVNVYMERGVAGSDAQFQLIERDRDRALAEIKEAADSNQGLFDLPLLQGSTVSGIARGAPIGSSEPSPYDWTDRQVELLGGR